MKAWILASILFFTPALAYGQVDVTNPGTAQLAWDHDGINVDSFVVSVDGQDQTPIPFVASPNGTYTTAFPALTPGLHTLRVAACNIAGCRQSDPFDVNVVVVPSQPTGLRITGG